MATRVEVTCATLAAVLMLASCADKSHDGFELAAAACRNEAVEAGLNPNFKEPDAIRQQYWEDCMKSRGALDADGNLPR